MFLDEIAGRLVHEGVGVINQDIFLGSLSLIPAGDGPYLNISETGGTSSAKTQNGTATERPTAQLKARGASYHQARALLHAAYTALGGPNGLHNVTLSGVQYLRITARQGLTDTGLDDAGRATLVFNIEVEKEPS